MAYYDSPDLVGFVQRNAMLDVAPISNAIEGWKKQQQQDIENQRAAEQLGMQRERLGMEKTRFSDERLDKAKQAAGNLALLKLQYPDKYGDGHWKGFMDTHLTELRKRDPNATLDPAYYDPALGPMKVLADSGMAQQFLDYQMRKASDARAAAAEGRAAGLYPGQKQLQDIQVKRAQREVDTPKMGTADLAPGHSRLFYDERDPTNVIGRISAGEDPNLGPYKDAKQKADVEEGLRKEVTQHAKEFNTVNDAAQQLDAISRTPSAAKDMAMVFAFMKILDPNSVVRETEYASAARAAGLGDRIEGYITKIQSGQFLTPEQRLDFLNTAKSLASSKQQGYQQTLDRYRDIAGRVKVDPRNVVPDGPGPTKPPPVPNARQASDGNWYVPDPNRPGKYLMVKP